MRISGFIILGEVMRISGFIILFVMIYFHMYVVESKFKALREEIEQLRDRLQSLEEKTKQTDL